VLRVAAVGDHAEQDRDRGELRRREVGSKTHGIQYRRQRAARGSSAPPERALTLRLKHPRRPRADRIAVVVQAT
jgi:hypothetical protein